MLNLEMPSHRHRHGMADEIVFAVGGLSECHTISQRQSVQWVGLRSGAAGYDGRAAARPHRLE
jgi:hypothetical protein